jgi:hypothetical protein
MGNTGREMGKKGMGWKIIKGIFLAVTYHCEHLDLTLIWETSKTKQNMCEFSQIYSKEDLPLYGAASQPDLSLQCKASMVLQPENIHQWCYMCPE